MLSPNPLSLLCLPLAIVFTVTTTPDSSSSATTYYDDPVTGSSASTATAVGPHDIREPGPVSSPPDRRPPVIEDDQKGGIESLSLPCLETELQRIKNATAAGAARPLPPVSYDDPEDDALFRVASRAGVKVMNPKKVAYMFLTTGLLPLAVLREMYFKNAPKELYNVYVHSDPGSHYNLPFTGVFANHVIPSSKAALRATPMLISAARRLLSHALLDDPGNYMFVLLSPSCIPLRSFNFTREILTGSKRSFIEILDHEPGAYGRWAAYGEEAMLPELPLEDFRIGSQFWALKRSHARMVARDVALWFKFKLPCVRSDTCYLEENYFSTLLNMQDPLDFVPATLTHVDWRGRHDGHPRTYRVHEVGTDLIRRLKSDRPRYGDDRADSLNASEGSRTTDPFLFTRKFEPKALKPLMAIASDVIFVD